MATFLVCFFFFFAPAVVVAPDNVGRSRRRAQHRGDDGRRSRGIDCRHGSNQRVDPLSQSSESTQQAYAIERAKVSSKKKVNRWPIASGDSCISRRDIELLYRSAKTTHTI